MWKPWKKELHIQVSTEHGVISFSIVCPIFNELEEMCLLFLHTVPFSLELKELRNQFWKWMLSQAQLRKNYYINLESTLIRGVHASTIRRLLQRRIKYRKWKGRVRFIIHVFVILFQILFVFIILFQILFVFIILFQILFVFIIIFLKLFIYSLFITDFDQIHYLIFEIVYIFIILIIHYHELFVHNH